AVLESFAGVGYPFHGDAIKPGDTTLDIGAGAGVDALIAARIVGPGGHVIGLDLTPAMTGKLQQTAGEVGTDNLSVLQASAERLPLATGSVDSITSNGALNLVPGKRRAVAEMFRVLRPGGRLQIADVVIDRPVSVDCHTDPRLWVECVVGATVDEDFLAMFRDAGFEDVRLVRTIDYFSHSPSRQTREVAASFGARSVEVSMRRGAEAPSRAVQWLRRMSPRRVAASMWRRGVMGVAGLGMAILACYGGMAALGLLAVLGMGLAFDETLWAGAIFLFAALTLGAVLPGMKYHGAYGPGLLGGAGVAVIGFVMFVQYNMLIELLGFLLLAVAVWRDVRLRRREERRVLGLESQV
ncbi:MerC family mercury resistance protein, partial [Aquisalimonas sp.]|uniref:MerC family mercury resistance protein n=1 Tax=Aquisalimonas sp. TaxID=1872621 RepID=UPI0025BC6531